MNELLHLPRQLDLFSAEQAPKELRPEQSLDNSTGKVLQFPAPKQRSKKEQELLANIWEDIQHLKQK